MNLLELMILYTTEEASAASGLPLVPITCSEEADLPFNAGMLKPGLLPPLTPFHFQNLCPSPIVHVSAPTHG